MTQKNNWATIFDFHRKRMRLNQDQMAELIGKAQNTVSDYENGKLLPPLSQVVEMADLLSLTGTERSTFIEEAYLAHAPDIVRCLVQDLKVRVARLEKRLRAKGDLDP